MTVNGAFPVSLVACKTAVMVSTLGSGDGDAVAVFCGVGVRVGVGGVTGASVLVTTTIIGVVVGYLVAVADSVGVFEMVGVAVGVGSA